MKQLFFSLLLIACYVASPAQKVRVGVINTDSILLLSPEYAAARNATEKETQQIIHKMDSLINVFRAKQSRLDSMKYDENLPERKVYEHELAGMQIEYEILGKILNDSIPKKDSVTCAPFYRRLARASFVAAEKNKCSGTYDIHEVPKNLKSAKFTYVDVSADATREFLSPSAVVNKKRVGYCNMDSLLRLMPEYDGVRSEIERYAKNAERVLKGMQKEIDEKQKEYDSLASESSAQVNQVRLNHLSDLHYNFDAFTKAVAQEQLALDSLLTAPLRIRVNNAMIKGAQTENCPMVYDSKMVLDVWTNDEAEFIDLNAVIARELQLNKTK